MKQTSVILAALIAWWAVPGLCGTAGGGGQPVTIDGVVSLTPVEARSCLAAWLPLPSGQALAGVRWYNNDEQAVFPEVLAVVGTMASPGDITGAVFQAADCAGPSSGWAEVAFAEPVVSSTDGLYVVFVLPPFQEQDGIGLGGGPAIGYQVGEGGAPAWMSIDGEEWVRVCPQYKLAVEPLLIEAAEGMRVMRRLPTLPASEPEMAPAAVTALLPAQPNPFNPQTQIRFSLAEASQVELAIYDVKGQKVRSLVGGQLPAGPHAVDWTGVDDTGRGVASGMYLLRMQAGPARLTQKLHLIR
jgi:hypothetical protein